MNKEKQILLIILNECRKHLARMNSAYAKIGSLLPLSQAKIESLKDDEVAHLDQFLFRFSKLQDALGNKLFKSVLAILDEDFTNKSAIDIFNRLEQLEIVENYSNWKELRDLRNELAHDYEEDLQETAEKLNLLLNKKAGLQKYFDDVTAFLHKKGLD